MRLIMEYSQVSGYPDGQGWAGCKTADAYGLRLRLGRPARWLGSDDGNALCSPGLRLARLCWLLLHLDLRRRVSGQARSLVVAPLTSACSIRSVRSPNVQAYPVDAVPLTPWRGASLGGGVGAENLRHQAILMNHAPGAVTPPNPEMVQVSDTVGQRA
jgi:hypothetical protein